MWVFKGVDVDKFRVKKRGSKESRTSNGCNNADAREGRREGGRKGERERVATSEVRMDSEKRGREDKKERSEEEEDVRNGN